MPPRRHRHTHTLYNVSATTRAPTYAITPFKIIISFKMKTKTTMKIKIFLLLSHMTNTQPRHPFAREFLEHHESFESRQDIARACKRTLGCCQEPDSRIACALRLSLDLRVISQLALESAGVPPGIFRLFVFSCGMSMGIGVRICIRRQKKNGTLFKPKRN